jgi:hypothetical protein
MCNNRGQRRGRNGTSGFTIAEVLVASFVLIVGLAAVAGVVGSTLGNTERSEYMTQAATLATEKLEDLNRFPSSDADIAVTNGTSAGSLTSDSVQNVTVNGVTQPVNYYDEVYFSPTQGSLEETDSSLNAQGATQYTTTTYSPNGQITSSAPSSTPPSTSGSISFDRRWIIEANQPVTGVRRITVLVTLTNQQVQPPVTFQMSMVRP